VQLNVKLQKSKDNNYYEQQEFAKCKEMAAKLQLEAQQRTEEIL